MLWKLFIKKLVKQGPVGVSIKIAWINAATLGHEVVKKTESITLLKSKQITLD